MAHMSLCDKTILLIHTNTSASVCVCVCVLCVCVFYVCVNGYYLVSEPQQRFGLLFIVSLRDHGTAMIRHILLIVHCTAVANSHGCPRNNEKYDIFPASLFGTGPKISCVASYWAEPFNLPHVDI